VAAAHRIYARALFDAAKEQGKLDTVHEQLGELVQAMDDVPELGALLGNPELDRRAKVAAVDGVLADADELVRNFVRLVIEKGRAGELAEIVRELEALVARERRRLAVELTTAFELSDEQAGDIVRQIERASGRSVDATRTVDPSLIGGLVLQAGSQRVDASVRGRLQRLHRELSTQAQS
jgi:F-type H+-transporting ATPase subunit delta